MQFVFKCTDYVWASDIQVTGAANIGDTHTLVLVSQLGGEGELGSGVLYGSVQGAEGREVDSEDSGTRVVPRGLWLRREDGEQDDWKVGVDVGERTDGDGASEARGLRR